jgi:hypothetical protein
MFSRKACLPERDRRAATGHPRGLRYETDILACYNSCSVFLLL